MRQHEVRVHTSKDNLPRDEQLAWNIAAVAADKVAVERDVADDDRQPDDRQRRGRHRRDQPPPCGFGARRGARAFQA